MLARLKSWLVSLGPDHRLLQGAFRLQGWVRGCQVEFQPDRITVCRGPDRVTITPADYAQVPLMTLDIETYFRDVECPEAENGPGRALDFTRPALYRYRRSGLEMHFPGIPEDDVMEAYLYLYRPEPGQLVFDAGAHAGFTTYHFASLVGPRGRVVAFEPDDISRRYLVENLERHGVENVEVVGMALGERSGVQPFMMSGSMVSGLTSSLRYSAPSTVRDVPVLTLEDACERYGVPDLLKLDIEGAEVGVIRGAQSFLRQTPIRIACESMHWSPTGRWAYQELEPLLRLAGYDVESSDRFGTMYTWATPVSLLPAETPSTRRRRTRAAYQQLRRTRHSPGRQAREEQRARGQGEVA